MIYREIVHTCSNSAVAGAAVDSIGGEFAKAFAAEASRRKVSRGAFAAKLVREFASRADEIELQRVNAAAHKADHPILNGLRYILERGVDDCKRGRGSNQTPPAWMIAAAMANG